MNAAPDPCDGTHHRWRILSAEERAERYPGEARGVAIAECCGVRAVLVYEDGEQRWRVDGPAGSAPT